jgi:hypothetical protein
MSYLLNVRKRKKTDSLLKSSNNYLIHGIIFFLSVLFGTLYGIYLLGNQINPLNIDWLFNVRDPAMYFISWSYFRADSWHWPLTFSDSLAYPTGGNISYTDIIPLWAITFKAVSSWLPKR